MIKTVTVKDRIRFGIRKNHRASPLPKNLRVFGCDTETVKGFPHTFQVYDGKEPLLFYGRGKNIFWIFWDHMKDRILSKGVNLAYFHNLRFDLTILFKEYQRWMYEMFNDIRFVINRDRRKVKVKMIFGKVNAALIQEGNKKLRLLDSMHFTQTSLDQSLKMFNLPYEKKERPEGLGELYLEGEDFEDYAKTDVVAEYALAKKILEFHEKYKVSPCVSLPQFASKVFRHYYFEKDTLIEFPPENVRLASELSYHGGKNGFYLDRPQIVKKVYEVDINSSYPNAMRHLPQMTKGSYVTVKTYEPYPGVYKISGWADPQRTYPLLFDSNFKRVDGDFENEYVTSYELDLMKESGHYRFQILEGYLWVPGRYKTNPFKGFVDDFYSLKEKTPKEDKALYNFYKITLNALYGKFISTVESRDVLTADSPKDAGIYGVDMVWDEALKKYVFTKKEWRASGMYNPFVGSLITGFARSELYKMEVNYEAIHSATDSVKTVKKPQTLPGLGGHKVECFGPCYFFRNKFYLHYAESFDCCSHLPRSVKDKLLTGEHLCKIALHGYKAKTIEGIRHLIDHRDEFMETHHLTYSYKHVVGLREGLKRGETPANFVDRDEIVCLCSRTDVKCKDNRFKCHCGVNKN